MKVNMYVFEHELLVEGAEAETALEGARHWARWFGIPVRVGPYSDEHGSYYVDVLPDADVGERAGGLA